MISPDSVGLPVRAALHPTGLYLARRGIGPADLVDAFLHQTTTRLPGPEIVQHIAVGDIGAMAPTEAPAGIIFHVGRCGSTALSQALKQHGDLVVYSEPRAFNELLSSYTWPRELVVAALRSLASAFARHAGKSYVLKLSSWSTLYCDVLLEAFPHAPWTFMVRDPLEVGEAIVRDPPPWFRGASDAAQHISRIVDREARAATAEAFVAQLYRALCHAILRCNLEHGRLDSYENGIRPAPVARHFGLRVDKAQERRMKDSLVRYAKAPLSAAPAFTSDSAAKQAAVSEELRLAIADIAVPALERVQRAFAAG